MGPGRLGDGRPLPISGHGDGIETTQEEKQDRRRRRPLRRIAHHLEAMLGAGLLVILPIGITLLVLKFFFRPPRPPIRALFGIPARSLHHRLRAGGPGCGVIPNWVNHLSCGGATPYRVGTPDYRTYPAGQNYLQHHPQRRGDVVRLKRQPLPRGGISGVPPPQA